MNGAIKGNFHCTHQLEVPLRAPHLPEKLDALEVVRTLGRAWFEKYLVSGEADAVS